MHAHTHTYAQIHTHANTHTRRYTYIQTHIHVYAHIQAHIHTQTRNLVDEASGVVKRQSSDGARGTYKDTCMHIKHTYMHIHTQTHNFSMQIKINFADL